MVMRRLPCWAGAARVWVARDPAAPYCWGVPARSRWSHRGLVVAAALTVLGAVAFDLIAGEDRLHTATLGVIALTAALLRIGLRGRHQHLLRFVSGSVVVQPALHFSAKLMPHHPLEHGVGDDVGPADLAVIGTQVTVALAIVIAVAFTEQLVVLATGAVRIWRVLVQVYIPDVEPRRQHARRAPSSPLLTSRYRPGSIPRRGPPLSARFV